MRKAEQRVWDSMKRNAPSNIWMERVENMVKEGMPDVWVAAHGKHSWVELKAAKLPVRATTPLLGKDGLRQTQLNWHYKAAQRGLPVYTLIRDDKNQIYFISCQHSEQVNRMTATELSKLSLAHSWGEVFEYLRKEN